MGFFKPKSPVDVDEFDWLVAAFAWLHRHLGTGADGELIVPTLALPETPSLVAASSGSELFAAVKDLAGMGEWECLLEQGDPLQQNGHLADM